MPKTFSPDLYELDDPAKYQVQRWLTNQMGFKEVTPNPDQYGIDLIGITPKGLAFGCEVEVKHNWIGREFPYDEVHVSARKIKFLDSAPVVFLTMLNHDRSSLLLIPGKAFVGATLQVKRTIYTKDEWFISVPIGKCYEYLLR